MAYSTQADIETFFGTTNVAMWSQVDQTSTAANTARIAAAIAHADAEIDSRMRGGRYAVPLAGGDTSYIVKSWSFRLAGVWLYESRGLRDATDDGRDANRIAFHRKDVLQEIAEVMLGARQLDLGISMTPGAMSPSVV